MTKNLFLVFLPVVLLFSNCALLQPRSEELKILHYNIWEYDSSKIQGDHEIEQQKALSVFLKRIQKSYSPNIISLNEIQFDKTSVPTSDFKTEGKNLDLILKKHFPLPKEHKDQWSVQFAEANTGKKARKYKGSYLTPNSTLPKNKRAYADQVNYGLFPGQYSSGLATTFAVLKKTVIKDLTWKKFNPKIKLTSFRDGVGKRLPKDMTLFDKTFTDTVIDFYGKEVHVISLHTVPSYHFGNKRSPNYHRNRDQLRFLEWYLTGKTDILVDLKTESITPLKEGATYVAVGDWNTDLNDPKNLGSKVLRRLANTGRLFPTEGVTFETPGYSKKRRTMLLDYLFHSPDLLLKEANVLRPKEKRLFLGCGKDSLTQKEEPGRVWVTTKGEKAENEVCHYTVSEKYHTAKKASDHFPISAVLVWRPNN